MNKWILGMIAVALTRGLFAHSAHHYESSEAEKIVKSTISQEKILQRIGERYQREVEPIFKKSCFDCHSDQTRYPWYYRIPGVKQMIDDDIEDARRHLDMSRGFPFEGHGEIADDLRAIQEVVKENEMPPWNYRLMHWGSGLNRAEKEKISEWAREALSFLQQEEGRNAQAQKEERGEKHGEK